MAREKVYSYELSMKWGNKIIVGLETTGFKMTGNYEEMMLKEDEGEAKEEFIDIDAGLTFSGRTIERDASEASTHEDFETLREAVAVGATVSFAYGRFQVGKKIVTGQCTIREWGEDAGSERQLASWSGSAKLIRGTIGFPIYST
ncbi:MAG TPA: hypothetical protein PK727_04630 [Bacteroidales bacterium]|jgi:hypothetical protein|nr:hypothetical protein [Bacteroidales bacterium]HOG56594.1 hypothetical protein [Bacteroidales bacterium]